MEAADFLPFSALTPEEHQMTTILLVDDDSGIQSLYGKLLREEGYEVYQALSAAEATRHMITRKIDLILLDINMPEVDGAVMREVIDEYDTDLKVIVSSVYPLVKQREKISRADQYFDKSHGTEMLLSIIREVLQKHIDGAHNVEPK